MGTYGSCMCISYQIYCTWDGGVVMCIEWVTDRHRERQPPQRYLLIGCYRKETVIYRDAAQGNHRQDYDHLSSTSFSAIRQMKKIAQRTKKSYFKIETCNLLALFVCNCFSIFVKSVIYSSYQTFEKFYISFITYCYLNLIELLIRVKTNNL